MNLSVMLNTLNTKLFFAINNLAGHNHFFDTFFIFLTDVGFKLIFVIVFMYLFIVLPFKKVNPVERLHAWGQAVLIAISTFLTWALVWYIKVLAMAPRPFEMLGGVRQLVEESFKTSFPSNHAALSISLATAVYFYHKKLGIFLFIIAILICLSRIYVGVHFPVDIIVGALIGAVIPLGVASVFKRSRE